MSNLREEVRKAVREADYEDCFLTDAQLEAILLIIDVEKRKTAELYEEGFIYVGKRGSKP